MKLKKQLGLLDVFCIATGAMISSGIFILPGIAHAQAGPAVILSYFLAGLLALTGMLSQAELVSAMPKAGGTYFYVTRSMGTAVGTVDGIITWFSLSLKTAFALVGMAAFTTIITGMDIRIIAGSLCAVFVITNILGIKKAGRIQVGLVIALLAILAYYVARGMPSINIHHFDPFAPNGLSAVVATAGFVFISYGGLLKVAAIAEEVKNPAHTVPLGMILSLFIVSVFYILVVFVTSGVLGSEKLDHSLTPISDGAYVFLGSKGMILLSTAAILAFVSTANAGIMSASRYPFALSKDGLLPECFGRIGNRFKTPHVSIVVTGIFVSLFLFLRLDILVKVASTVLILSFLFSCLSVLIMRESHVQNYQPQFHSPLYPWVQIVGIVGFIALIFGMRMEALLISSTIVAGGFFLYWFYGRIRTTKEYALLHLIERITSKDLTDRMLETELKEIIRERDDITKDRFDHVVENSVVLDIDKPVRLEEFLAQAADAMAPRLNVESSRLAKMLLERERESSTAISAEVAIPHIVLEGEKGFDILIARCRPGITFSDSMQRIQAVFMLLGTADERNFHLRALASVAQLVQEPGFGQRWLRARGEEGIRDVILLGRRIRAADHGS